MLCKRSIYKPGDVYYRYDLSCIYFSKSCDTLNLLKELPWGFYKYLSLAIYFIDNYTHFLPCKINYDNVPIFLRRFLMPPGVFQDILQSYQGQIISSEVNTDRKSTRLNSSHGS